MAAVPAKLSPSVAGAAGRRVSPRGGVRGAGGRLHPLPPPQPRVLRLRCRATAGPSPEVAPALPSAPEPTTAQNFLKCVPAGDERERDMCGTCGFVNYSNPKVVVGAVPLWVGSAKLCKALPSRARTHGGAHRAL